MIKLRPYQQELSDNVISALSEGHKDILVISPTASGKTISFIDISRRLIETFKDDECILMLSHLSLLTEQTKAKFEKFSNLPVGILQAKKQPDPDCRVIISTMQSSRVFDKVYEFLAISGKKVKVIIVDESHRRHSKSYADIFECFPDAQVIDFTATPFKNRKLATGMYDTVAFQVSLQELIDQKYIVPPTLVQIAVDEDELVRRCAVMFKIYQEREKGNKGIVFMSNKEECNMLVEAFTNGGVKAAVVTDSVTGKRRDAIFEGYDKNEYDVLVSVSVLEAGFDSTKCSFVQMWGTESPTVYMQRTGRALRPEDALSVKPHHAKQDARIYVLGDTPSIASGVYESHHNAVYKPKKKEDCKTLKEMKDYLEINDLKDTKDYREIVNAVRINKVARKMNMNILATLIENRSFPQEFLNNLVARIATYSPIAVSTAPITSKQARDMASNGVSSEIINRVTQNEAFLLLKTITGTEITPYDPYEDRFVLRSGAHMGKHVADAPWAYKSIILKKAPSSNIAGTIRAFHGTTSPSR